MTKAELMRHAAVLLAQEAMAVRGSCRVGEKDWACEDCIGHDCPSRILHEDMATTADKLLGAAE
jgi:hypothetical protein